MMRYCKVYSHLVLVDVRDKSEVKHNFATHIIDLTVPRTCSHARINRVLFDLNGILNLNNSILEYQGCTKHIHHKNQK